jgi:hypothetical protein
MVMANVLYVVVAFVLLDRTLKTRAGVPMPVEEFAS